MSWITPGLSLLLAAMHGLGISLCVAEANEPWVKEWKILNTLVEYGEGDIKLYYETPVRAGFGNPSPGRKGMLYLHPFSPTEPARISRQFKVSGAAPALAMGLCGNWNSCGDFVLEVLIDGKTLEEERIIDGAKGWQDLVFDLSGYRGRDITIEVRFKSNNWLYEYAFLDYAILVEDIKKVKAGAKQRERKSAVPAGTGDGGRQIAGSKPKLSDVNTQTIPSVTKKTVAGTSKGLVKQPTPQVKALSPSSQILIEDNFDTSNKGLANLHYRGFEKWYVRGGEVDLIGKGFRDWIPGNGLYADLNGTQLQSFAKTPGKLQSKQLLDLKAGGYTLEFDLAWQGGVTDRKIIIRVGAAYQKFIPLDVRGSGKRFVKNKLGISVKKPERSLLTFECVGKGTDYVLLDNIKFMKSTAETK